MKSQSRESKKLAYTVLDAILAPIITYTTVWADAIPERLKEAIKTARITSMVKNDEMATLPEVVAYIMTASLTFPLNHDWTEIYVATTCEVADKYWKEDHEVDLDPKKLDNYQLRLRDDLRRWIYKKRNEALKRQMKEKGEMPVVTEVEGYKQLELF